VFVSAASITTTAGVGFRVHLGTDGRTTVRLIALTSTMNPDGTGVTQLTFNTAFDGTPTFSDDGLLTASVVFTSERDGNREIYVMDSDGGNQTRITTTNTTPETNPTVHPNGFTIAFERFVNGDPEIILWVAGFEFPLTDNSAQDTGPAFSPDGTKIAFQSDRNGNNEIYVMDTDPNTADATNLSDNPAFDDGPDWSPDGSKIAFTSLRNGNYDIYAMNSSDGSSQKRLTKKGASDLLPAFSPDGKKIAFTSPRGGGDAEIYTMKAKPEGMRNRAKNLTKNDVSDLDPAWQPLVP